MAASGTDATAAVVVCGVCLGNHVDNLNVYACGHVVCSECLSTLKKQPRFQKICPYCRAPYQTPPYKLFADLAIANASSNLLQETRQRVLRTINGLGVASTPEELRQAYAATQRHRAVIRNFASGTEDENLRLWVLAITDALDSLEDRLHYSLQNQDLGEKVRRLKREATAQAQKHEAETLKIKAKLLSQESELQRSTHLTAKYKQKLDSATAQAAEAQKSFFTMASLNTELETKLTQVEQERRNFHAQLAEHKVKEAKQKAQIGQLKQQKAELEKQIEQMKQLSKSTGKQRQSPDLDESQGIIDLSTLSSSPPMLRSHSGQARKRPRAPDENQYQRNAEFTLLPPPKSRAAGPSRVPNERLQMVTRDKRVVEVVVKGNNNPSNSRSIVPLSPQKKKDNAGVQLQLGDSGLLLVPMKKRKLRAV